VRCSSSLIDLGWRVDIWRDRGDVFELHLAIGRRSGFASQRVPESRRAKFGSRSVPNHSRRAKFGSRSVSNHAAVSMSIPYGVASMHYDEALVHG
jgi:hypothetical protein